MTDILTSDGKNTIKLYPKDMHPFDLYAIQVKGLYFKFIKNTQGFVEIQFEPVDYIDNGELIVVSKEIEESK